MFKDLEKQKKKAYGEQLRKMIKEKQEKKLAQKNQKISQSKNIPNQQALQHIYNQHLHKPDISLLFRKDIRDQQKKKLQQQIQNKQFFPFGSKPNLKQYILSHQTPNIQQSQVIQYIPKYHFNQYQGIKQDPKEYINHNNYEMNYDNQRGKEIKIHNYQQVPQQKQHFQIKAIPVNYSNQMKFQENKGAPNNPNYIYGKSNEYPVNGFNYKYNEYKPEQFRMNFNQVRQNQFIPQIERMKKKQQVIDHKENLHNQQYINRKELLRRQNEDQYMKLEKQKKQMKIQKELQQQIRQKEEKKRYQELKRKEQQLKDQQRIRRVAEEQKRRIEQEKIKQENKLQLIRKQNQIIALKKRELEEQRIRQQQNKRKRINNQKQEQSTIFQIKNIYSKKQERKPVQIYQKYQNDYYEPIKEQYDYIQQYNRKSMQQQEHRRKMNSKKQYLRQMRQQQQELKRKRYEQQKMLMNQLKQEEININKMKMELERQKIKKQQQKKEKLSEQLQIMRKLMQNQGNMYKDEVQKIKKQFKNVVQEKQKIQEQLKIVQQNYNKKIQNEKILNTAYRMTDPYQNQYRIIQNKINLPYQNNYIDPQKYKVNQYTYEQGLKTLVSDSKKIPLSRFQGSDPFTLSLLNKQGSLLLKQQTYHNKKLQPIKQQTQFVDYKQIHNQFYDSLDKQSFKYRMNKQKLIPYEYHEQYQMSSVNSELTKQIDKIMGRQRQNNTFRIIGEQTLNKKKKNSYKGNYQSRNYPADQFSLKSYNDNQHKFGTKEGSLNTIDIEGINKANDNRLNNLNKLLHSKEKQKLHKYQDKDLGKLDQLIYNY